MATYNNNRPANTYNPYSLTFGQGGGGAGFQRTGDVWGTNSGAAGAGTPMLGATGLDSYSPHFVPQTQSLAPVPGTNTGQIPWQQQGLGMNLGTAQLAFDGLSSLGNMYAAFNANKLANKQFEFQKGVTEINLVNFIQSYNTALAGKAKSRGLMEGRGQAEIDAYVEQNKAVRR